MRGQGETGWFTSWFVGGLLCVGVVLLLAVIAWVIGIYNGLQRLRVAYETTFASIEVQLKRRHDLIPNLVEAVKGYAAHERGTFEEVIKARAAAQSAGTIAEKVGAENQLSGALGRLFAISEAYPDLKANQNFLQLQGTLAQTETSIGFSRDGYNGSVREFNTQLAVFPSNIIGGIFGFKAALFFQASEADRATPVVKF
ncbi:MAG: LemA family protein [Phycisphaerales bacterium]|nr:LemA family protein [Phycisphaerales bacterium]